MTGFDLGDAAPDADEEPEPVPEETDSSPEPEEPKEPETEPEPEPDPADAGPAFPYSEVKQSPLYAREETWKQFDLGVDTTVVPELRMMDIFDDELREIHDVALEIVLDNLDEIPERLAEKRRQSR